MTGCAVAGMAVAADSTATTPRSLKLDIGFSPVKLIPHQHHSRVLTPHFSGHGTVNRLARDGHSYREHVDASIEATNLLNKQNPLQHHRPERPGSRGERCRWRATDALCGRAE